MSNTYLKHTYLLSFLLFFYACGPSSRQQEDSLTEISFYTNFEGGNLGEVRQIGDYHWECPVSGESDWDDRNRQASWYYFRINGAKGKKLTLDLTDLVGEYNYKAGAHAITAETRPVISYDQIHWRHLTDKEVAWNEEKVELSLHIKPQENKIWIAHQPPYTNSRLAKLLSTYQDHPMMEVSPIGESAEGKTLQLLTLSNPAIATEDKKVIWLMARQHSWESGTSWVMEGALQFLLDTDEGNELLNAHIFKIMPMADPDGVARGGVRFNTHGHDLNRNWDLVKPEEMPEIYAQKESIISWLLQGNPIDIFLTLHNTEAADYIQGPDLEAGQKLFDYMSAHSTFKDDGLRSMPVTTTEGQRGRMTVNQALWSEQEVPAYLMELKVEKVEKLKARRTVDDWLALGPEVIRGLVASLK